MEELKTVIIKLNGEKSDKIEYLKQKFKIKTRTKVLLKCLDMTYDTMQKV